MYLLPLASQKYAPSARWTKRGVPPTARKARTGEFTPLGISARARSNSRAFRSSVFGVMRGEVEGWGGRAAILVVGFPGVGLGPEHAVRHHVAHARAEAAIEAAVQVGEGFDGCGSQVRAAGHERGQRCRQRVAGAGEHRVEALELFAREHRLR